MNVGVMMDNINDVMTCFYIDTEKDFAGEHVFANDLDTMRRMTHSKAIAVTLRTIGGHPFRIIMANRMDDGAKVSGLDEKGNVVFTGSIIILGDRTTVSGRPGLRTLSEEEKDILFANLGIMLIEDNKDHTKDENVYCICNIGQKGQ